MTTPLRLMYLLLWLAVVTPVRAEAPPTAIAAEAKFLPDNCQMVVAVRVEQLLGSTSYTQIRKDAPAVAAQENAITRNLPLPLEQISVAVMGGPVTGGGEGLFVLRTRKPIKLADIEWHRSTLDVAKLEKAGKYDMYRRQGESYCLVAADLLVFGKASAPRTVLERDAAPSFSASLTAALKETDLTATVVFALDVADIRENRGGAAVPFIPGLQLARTEAAANGLAMTAKFGDTVDVKVAALPSTGETSVATLKEEAARFKTFHVKTLGARRNATPEVLAIFNFTVSEGTPVTASTRFGPAPFVQLLKLLNQ